MRKLFRGSFRGIPVAILVVALLLTAGAGAVLAAGYVLTTVDVTMTVPEPISVYRGSEEVGLDGWALTLYPWPGVCFDEQLSFSSAAPHDLLLKAVVEVSGPSEGVSVMFWSNGDVVDLEGAGVIVNLAASPMPIRWEVCIPGDAVPGAYTISVSFTRESPPVNGDE